MVVKVSAAAANGTTEGRTVCSVSSTRPDIMELFEEATSRPKWGPVNSSNLDAIDYIYSYVTFLREIISLIVTFHREKVEINSNK